MKPIILKFLKSYKINPILAAIAAGLYPLLYYYNANFFMVNSWQHLMFFILVYLIFPYIIFLSCYAIFKKYNPLKSYSKFVLPILNMCYFTVLMTVNTFGVNKKIAFILLIVLVFISVFAVLLYKHINKIIVFQLLLVAVIVPTFIIKLYDYKTNATIWFKQPDAIEHVNFKKHPNVYVIQPDGYVNFSEIKKGYYQFNNTSFEAYLKNKKFKLYANFKSNYYSTLYTNSAMFMMKHHYYKNPSKQGDINYNFRKNIVEDNLVNTIFKKNNYKTHLLLPEPYFLLNRSEMSFDYCNIEYKDIKYLSRGFDMQRNTLEALKNLIKVNTKNNNFYFIQHLSPGHIANLVKDSKGKTQEKDIYLGRIKDSNTWLKNTIDFISKHDDNALIVLVADHGGFVGYDYVMQSSIKNLDSDLLNSAFSSMLAIKWPEDATTDLHNELKSSVNLFRVLISYLSNDRAYLKHTQEDSCYLVIDQGAPFGVYEVIDSEGNVVFNKITH